MIDIKDKVRLWQAVKDISGDWKSLCESLKVGKSKLSELKNSFDGVVNKMADCLEAYINSARASWEEVVVVVAKFPISNPRLAREIANNNLKGSSKEKVLKALRDDACAHSDYSNLTLYKSELIYV